MSESSVLQFAPWYASFDVSVCSPPLPESLVPLLSSCYCKSEHNVLLGIFIEPDERLKGPEGPKALDKQFI